MYWSSSWEEWELLAAKASASAVCCGTTAEPARAGRRQAALRLEPLEEHGEPAQAAHGFLGAGALAAAAPAAARWAPGRRDGGTAFRRRLPVNRAHRRDLRAGLLPEPAQVLEQHRVVFLRAESEDGGSQAGEVRLQRLAGNSLNSPIMWIFLTAWKR